MGTKTSDRHRFVGVLAGPDTPEQHRRFNVVMWAQHTRQQRFVSVLAGPNTSEQHRCVIVVVRPNKPEQHRFVIVLAWPSARGGKALLMWWWCPARHDKID